jgi:ATP-dependent helicase/nuclease subunit B
LIRLPDPLSQVIQDGGCIVVPSRQRAHAARLAYAAAQLKRGARVWATPDILPLEGWLIREVEEAASVSGTRLPRVLSPAEDWLLWRQCTEDAAQDLELLNRGALADALRRASSLAAEFGIDLTKPPVLAGAESELLWRAHEAVMTRCQELEAATMPSLAAQLTRDRVSGSPPAGVPVAVGFLKLPPRLGALGFVQRAVESPTTRPRALVAADELEELESIAGWCKQRILEQPDARLLVVLNTSPGERERLATLIRQAVDPQGWLNNCGPNASGANTQGPELVVIEGGASLSEIPLVAHALSTLRWLGGANGEFDDVSEWLRSPYWKAPTAALRARIDLWLRERRELNVSGADWVPLLSSAPAPVSAAAQELARQIKNGAEALGGGAASPRQWSERFRAALEAMNWPGDRVRDSSEQQTVVRFHELLDEFGQLASSARAMSRREAIHWFDELASRTAFRPADADAVVTISGTLSDPVVLYDGIWVAALHAEAFPQPVQPDPFLPLPAQVAAGVPAATAAGRLAEARALVSAWRAATQELVLSAPARAQDLELLPSPLLREWLDAGTAGAAGATADAVPTMDAAPSWLPYRLRRPHMLESIDDTIGLPWNVELPLPSGTRSLELQNACGFRAYAEMRLGGNELDQPEPGVARDVRGRLMHAALQVLWKQLRDSRTLAGHGEATLDALIETSVLEAAKSNLPAITGTDYAPLFARELRRTQRLIKILCALELDRGPFTVQETEFELSARVAGARMNVRIDRLDALDSGGRAILDYKTGSKITADWYGERPSHPQLLAYLAALQTDVVAMATVNVTAREVRFDGIARAHNLLPKVRGVESPNGGKSEDAWEIRTQEWLARIEQLAMDFLAGRAPVDPKPNACDYCHIVSVCRVADRGLDVATDLLWPQFGIDDERPR